MRLLRTMCRDIAADIIETLPRSERDAGVWVAGFCWAFVIFCVLLVVATMGWAAAHGVRL